MHRKKTTVPEKGSDGPRRRGPPLRESGHGLMRHSTTPGRASNIHSLSSQRLFTPIRDESSKTKLMHELCILGGEHKTKTIPYHPESDGLVERFNRTLLMFAGEHKDDWDDLLPRASMNLRASAHTDFVCGGMYVAHVYWHSTSKSGSRGRCREPICRMGEGFVGSRV